MKRKSGIIKKLLVVSLTLSLTIPLMAACSKKSGEVEQQKVLRIGTVYSYGDDDSYLRQQLTDIFEYTHPEIKVEIVSAINGNRYNYDSSQQEKPEDQLKKVKEMLTGPNPPDLIIPNFDMMQDLINDNMLVSLNPNIEKDKIDLNEFVPTVVEGLKSLSGDGNLYALSPTFYSSALYYNKKLFTDAQVEPPTDKMTWDDVFSLARRVTKGEGKDRKFGFSFSQYAGSDPIWNMQQIYAGPLGLNMFDTKGEKMTVDSPQWERVWTTVSGMYKDKIIPQYQDISPQDGKDWSILNEDPFMGGRVAMVIGDYGYISRIIDMNKNAEKIKNFQRVDWDVVTLPTHPEAPGVGGSIGMSNPLAINAKAQNPDSAWEFIKFVTSEEWAKLKSRNTYELVLRKKYIQPREGLNYNIPAFYTLTPAMPSNDSKLLQKIQNLWSVQDIGRPLFEEVMKGSKSVKDALKEFKTKGDAMLEQIKKNPNGPLQMEGNGVTTEIYR